MPSPNQNNQIIDILQSAFRFHHAGQFHEAENCCLNVCNIISNQPDALHLLAIIHAQTKRFQTANHYFQEAIKSAPKRADFLGNYANALWEQGHIDEAIQYCKQSLEENLNQAEVHNILGNAYLANNHVDAAIKSFRFAIQIRPHSPHALNNLGNALQRINDFESAIACYQQAIEIQKDYPEAYNNLGQLFKKTGKISQAREYFQKAIELHPEFAEAITNHAEVDTTWIDPIDGKKLYLRRYQQEDAAYLRECYQNVTFMQQYNQYIQRHQRIDELANQLQQAHELHPCQSKSVDWIIVKKSSEQKVGIVNLVEIQFAHRRAEFLIGIPDPQNHTQGIGLETTLLVFDFAFNRVALNKLTANVYKENLFAQKNALTIGFLHEGNLHEQIVDLHTKKFHDICCYGITMNSFRSNQKISTITKRFLGRDITAP